MSTDTSICCVIRKGIFMTISVSVIYHMVVASIYNHTLQVYCVPLCSGSASASFGSFSGRLAKTFIPTESG